MRCKSSRSSNSTTDIASLLCDTRLRMLVLPQDALTWVSISAPFVDIVENFFPSRNVFTVAASVTAITSSTVTVWLQVLFDKDVNIQAFDKALLQSSVGKLQLAIALTAYSLVVW